MGEAAAQPFVRKFLNPKDLGLDPVVDGIFIAILRVENQFDPNGMRYEKDYTYIYDAERHARMNGITLETEMQLQKFSYGLGQLMGGTARFLGFQGMLHRLIDVETNVHWCKRYFDSKVELYMGDVWKAVAAYNAGSFRRDDKGQVVNQQYVDKVRRAAGITVADAYRWTSKA